MRLAVKRALFLLFLASCKPGPPPKQNVAPLMHATGNSFDTFSLGDPVGSFIDRFGDACDSDPIDKERSTLFFWAGAEGCKEQKPFPDATTVVVLTPYSKALRDQPIDLLAWFGGPYFNTRSSLKAKIGDAAGDVETALGEIVHKDNVADLKIGDVTVGNLRQITYAGDVHVLFRDDRAVAIAVGKLKGGAERESTLVKGYENHLRYVKAN